MRSGVLDSAAPVLVVVDVVVVFVVVSSLLKRAS
jgi:hypothetical protein